MAAREICETLWQQPGDEAFIAGLLQDLGVLVLIKELGKPVRAVPRQRFVSQGGELAAMEVQAMGFTTVQLSARLLAEWGLPDPLVEAVGWDPSRRHADELPASPCFRNTGHLSELIAQLLVDQQHDVLSTLLHTGHQYHDLSEHQLETMVGTLEEKVRNLADVLSLQLPPGVNYEDVLNQSQMQLAEIAAVAAGDLLRRQARDDVPARPWHGR